MYQGMGGDTFFARMKEETAQGAYWGDYNALMENVHIIGLGTVTLSLKAPSQYGNFIVSAINLKGNAIVENIDIEMENCRYAIHDQVISRETDLAKPSLNGGKSTFRKYINVNTICYDRGINCGYVGATDILIDGCNLRCSKNGGGSGYSYHGDSINLVIKDSIIDGAYFHSGSSRYCIKVLNSYINGNCDTGNESGTELPMDYGNISIINSYLKNGIERRYVAVENPINYINRVTTFNEENV
jgi:hypothetical protein